MAPSPPAALTPPPACSHHLCSACSRPLDSEQNRGSGPACGSAPQPNRLPPPAVTRVAKLLPPSPPRPGPSALVLRMTAPQTPVKLTPGACHSDQSVRTRPPVRLRTAFRAS